MYTLGHIWVNLVGQYALNQAFKSSLDGVFSYQLKIDSHWVYHSEVLFIGLHIHLSYNLSNPFI